MVGCWLHEVFVSSLPSSVKLGPLIGHLFLLNRSRIPDQDQHKHSSFQLSEGRQFSNTYMNMLCVVLIASFSSSISSVLGLHNLVFQGYSPRNK